MAILKVQGHEVLVDDEDLPTVQQYSWYICRGYVRSSACSLHRLLVDCPAGYEVDHRNRNKLDNRRCNLRVATVAENRRNKSHSKNNTSGFKGVSWDKEHELWEAHIKVNGKKRKIGRFPTKEIAACAYIRKAIELHGAFFTTG
jgi:hypothetical protein